MNSALGVHGPASKSMSRRRIAQAIGGIPSGTGTPKTIRKRVELTGFDPVQTEPGGRT